MYLKTVLKKKKSCLPRLVIPKGVTFPSSMCPVWSKGVWIRAAGLDRCQCQQGCLGSAEGLSQKADLQTSPQQEGGSGSQCTSPRSPGQAAGQCWGPSVPRPSPSLGRCWRWGELHPGAKDTPTLMLISITTSPGSISNGRSGCLKNLGNAHPATGTQRPGDNSVLPHQRQDTKYQTDKKSKREVLLSKLRRVI